MSSGPEWNGPVPPPDLVFPELRDDPVTWGQDLHFHDQRNEAVLRIFETIDLADTETVTITCHTSQAMLKAYTKLRPNALAARPNGKNQDQLTGSLGSLF